MDRRPTGGRTLARVGNAIVALALFAGAVAAVAVGEPLAGVGLAVLAVLLLPGVVYPRYNVLAWAIDLAIRFY